MCRSLAILQHREPKTTSASGGQNNRAATAERQGVAAYPAAPLFEVAEKPVFGCEALYEAAFKCFRGVGWKYSTQNYRRNVLEQTVRLARDLAGGTYREGRTHPVHLTYPKKREAIAICLRDRVLQRSLNDNVLYPSMTRPLIWANFACQKGKGTDAARDYYRRALRGAYPKYGLDDLVIVAVDFKDYYGTMRHDLTNAMFRRRTPEPFASMAVRTLDRQYKGGTGYNPGSQMVQIAGISYLDGLDHYMKERFGARFYVHYMDDIHAFMPRRDAEAYLDAVRRESAKVGLTVHPDKTRVVDARDGAVFLGFWYRLSPTGRVLVSRDPKRVKEIRRRLRRLAHKERRGEAPRGATARSYECVRSCMSKGNTRRLIRRMDRFFNTLKGEIENG